MSQYNANISVDYSTKVNNKFDENQGKLFLVDYSKSCALQALSGLLTKHSPKTMFLLVDDREIAEEFAVALTPVVGEFTIVDDYDAFKNCLEAIDAKGCETSDKAMHGISRKFKEKFPRLIVTATDKKGNPLIHKILGKDSSKGGVYNSANETRSYCISDFIAVCHYEFVVVDNIYNKFSFEKVVGKKNFPAGQYDKFTFLGKPYYASTAHSYKRLNSIIDGAKYAVILSDIVVDGDVANLYVIIELLHGDFSYADVQQQVAAITSSYDQDCARAYSDLSFCKDDEGILSKCLQYLKGSKQNIPADINSFKQYLEAEMAYMSEEEIFLRLVWAQMRNRFNGKCTSLDGIFDSLESEDGSDMARCICDVFFRETSKSELEGVLSTSHIHDLTKEQVSAMFAVFLKYGVYHPFPQKNDGFKILRLKRDDSGFEAFVREQSSDIIEDENSYSITKEGSARLYQCIALQRFLDGRDQQSKAEAPVLIVANRNLDKIREVLQSLLPDYHCTEDIHTLAQKDVQEKTIALVNYEHFRKTALWLHVKTVVFFGMLADIVVLKNLINKALRYRDVKVYLMTNYGDMSGHLADMWQGELLSTKQKAMPIDNSEVFIKGGESTTYTEVMCAIEEVYSSLEKLTSVGQRRQITPAANRYNKLLSEYTLLSTLPCDVMEQDFTYLIAMSKYFNGVFKNCVSIGGKGEEVIIERLKFVRYMKEKKKRSEKKKPSKKKPKMIEVIEERKDVTQERKIYFNVCAGMLRRSCNLKANNCNGCSNYDKFKKNNFQAFCANLGKFFAESKEFVERVERRHFMDSIDRKINSQQNEEARQDCLTLSEIEKNEASIQSTLKALKKGVQALDKQEELFSVDYQTIATICEAVQKTYCKLLKKYYNTIMQLFQQVTDDSKAGFKMISDSFLSAHESV